MRLEAVIVVCHPASRKPDGDPRQIGRQLFCRMPCRSSRDAVTDVFPHRRVRPYICRPRCRHHRDLPGLSESSRSGVIRRQIHEESQGSTNVAPKDGSVHNRTLISLRFLVRLPSVEAKGRWRERGNMSRRQQARRP
jgi:hypothetical protein